MKNLAIDYRFVRDLVTNKELLVSHVPSSHQLKDLLTKPLSSSWHFFLLDKIGVHCSSTILRGHIGVVNPIEKPVANHIKIETDPSIVQQLVTTF